MSTAWSIKAWPFSSFILVLSHGPLPPSEESLKTKNIVEQSKLNKEDRIKNIHGVYELINKEKLFDKKILLVDDIYTTGSTVSECAKELKKARPREIGVFTLAKD